MSQETTSPVPAHESLAKESPAKLAEIGAARITLQMFLMQLIGEKEWTLEHGRAFSLLFPPQTSPGAQKEDVLKALHDVQYAPSPEARAFLLGGILERMKNAPVDRRIEKRIVRGKGLDLPRATA